MVKLALAALISTSAPAMAIDVEANTKTLVGMSIGSFYCGIKIPERVAYDILMETAIVADVDEELLANAIDKKAHELRRTLSDKQMRRFCANIKLNYKQAGINQY